jgi:hypothetical protein
VCVICCKVANLVREKPHLFPSALQKKAF